MLLGYTSLLAISESVCQSCGIPVGFRTRGNRYKLKHREVPSEHEEELLHSEGDGALEQVAQRDCGFCFSGDIQNPPGWGPVQPRLGDPALAGGGRTRWSPEVPSNPYHSVILWFCDSATWLQRRNGLEDTSTFHVAAPERVFWFFSGLWWLYRKSI